MTTTHPVTELNGTLLDTQDVVRDLLAHFPQLGVATEVTVCMDKTVRVSINPHHTRQPAAVLLAWAALLAHPKITGRRMDPMFTLVHVQGVHSEIRFTVTAEFGEPEITGLLHETGGDLTVHDLQQLQIAGVR